LVRERPLVFAHVNDPVARRTEPEVARHLTDGSPVEIATVDRRGLEAASGPDHETLGQLEQFEARREVVLLGTFRSGGWEPLLARRR